MKLVFVLIFLLLACVNFSSAQGTDASGGTSGLKILDYRWLEWVETRNNLGDFEREGPPKDRNGEPMARVWKTYMFFNYQATINNQTGRTIKGITWNYIFKDPETGKELKRHTFLAPAKIGMNKTKVLKAGAGPPTDMVGAGDLGKGLEKSYGQAVEIRCIIFDDNSVWRDKNAPERDCELIRAEIKRIEKESRRIF